ncbi:hypothetical protein Mp_1g06390 [Marchantia polymorpha subsp. ruderalis]|uniref:Uncharacterized protein n=2 Tax=Marchantia polymorpha TaxID=3197 RepID=A0AAF6AM58_MARPO|nr:hypothetical protein MARPO_0043s0031 [Marchantia polymorpha]BBM97528.1 hypothetical protein Mp_1g06390 [Marchantia polymorpha subsp. ruderalis]|eukprot:PTQ39767.1 hypothetical protein MARPO_0043s0031 [Marchantia polymorpha]
MNQSHTHTFHPLRSNGEEILHLYCETFILWQASDLVSCPRVWLRVGKRVKSHARCPFLLRFQLLGTNNHVRWKCPGQMGLKMHVMGFAATKGVIRKVITASEWIGAHKEWRKLHDAS